MYPQRAEGNIYACENHKYAGTRLGGRAELAEVQNSMPRWARMPAV